MKKSFIIVFLITILCCYSCNLLDNDDLEYYSIIYDFVDHVTDYQYNYKLDPDWDDNDYVVLDPDYEADYNEYLVTENDRDIIYPVFRQTSNDITMLNFAKTNYTKDEFKKYLQKVNSNRILEDYKVK